MLSQSQSLSVPLLPSPGAAPDASSLQFAAPPLCRLDLNQVPALKGGFRIRAVRSGDPAEASLLCDVRTLFEMKLVDGATLYGGSSDEWRTPILFSNTATQAGVFSIVALANYTPLGTKAALGKKGM